MLDKEGQVTVVYGHDYGKGRDFTVHTERRVRMKPIEPLLPSVHYVCGLDIGYIAGRIGRSRRLGVVNFHALRKNFYDELLRAVPELTWVDMRVDLTMLRVVRSEEEKEAIACTARAQEKIMAAVPLMLREGRYMKDAVADMQHYAYELGCGRDEIFIFTMRYGMENDGQRLPRFVPMIPLNYDAPGKLEKGWVVQVMLESNSYGGIMLDTGRLFSLGEPHPVTKAVWDDARRIQRFAVDMLRPGMTCRRIMQISQEYAAAIGRDLAFGNFCHGLGNSRTEGPDVRDETTCDIPFTENMHLLCEPNLVYKIREDLPMSIVLIPDSYYVSKDGGIQTTKIPHEIAVIE